MDGIMSEMNENRDNLNEEDFTSFLLSLELPAYRHDMALSDAIRQERESFLAGFNQAVERHRFRSFSDSFYNGIQRECSSVLGVFDALINILSAYDNCDLASAQNQFDLLMNDLKNHLLLSHISWWPNGSAGVLYRVRSYNGQELKEPKDLFHIPYTQRHRMSNERYSHAGYPCLYLSSFVRIAWEECGYPKKYYYSGFQYQQGDKPENEWKFITFISPRQCAQYFVAINQPEDTYLRIACDYLHIYPLVFACSIVNLNGGSSFKTEYIISQMLTQWVFRNPDYAKGIKYFSCHPTDELLRYNGFNVVLVTKDFDERGYSKELIGKFKVSMPILADNKKDDSTLVAVQQYKTQLLVNLRTMPREAWECISKMYDIANMLEKTIINLENSSMDYILTAIHIIRVTAPFILKSYQKTDIIDKCKAEIGYTSRMETTLNTFEMLYDSFKPQIIEAAERYDRSLRFYPANIDKFYQI